MEKISPIKENILKYIEFKGITKVDFCKKTEISYANIKGKGLFSEIGGTQIGKILSVYSEISPEWLLTGRGEMLRNNAINLSVKGNHNVQSGNNSKVDVQHSGSDSFAILQAQLAEKDVVIRELLEQNKKLIDKITH